MAQRRQVLDTGFLPNVITGTLSEFQKRREQRYKLEQLFEAALASKRAEAMFPSAEEQAKQVVLERAMNVGRVPQPLGGYNPQERAEETARNRQMEWLQHLLPQSAATTLVQPMVFDPNTGEYRASGQTVLRGTPVRNLPLTEETLEGQSKARARGSAEGSPQKRAITQNFKDIASGIERIDAFLAKDPGFKGQLFATALPLQPWAGQLTDELRNVADILLRARSGAQINEREYARLRTLLPKSRDAISELFGNPGRARQKLVKFRQSMQEILQTGTPSTFSDETLLSFTSEAEAEAAKLAPGTPILINGRSAVWE